VEGTGSLNRERPPGHISTADAPARPRGTCQPDSSVAHRWPESANSWPWSWLGARQHADPPQLGRPSSPEQPRRRHTATAVLKYWWCSGE
jgi:hypothetical protein